MKKGFAFFLILTLVCTGVFAKEYEHYAWYYYNDSGHYSYTVEIFSPPNEKIDEKAIEVFQYEKDMNIKSEHHISGVTYIYNTKNVLLYVIEHGTIGDLMNYKYCYTSICNKLSGITSYEYWDTDLDGFGGYGAYLYLVDKLLEQIYPSKFTATEQKYKIGDKGPGGGIIFYVAGNVAYEVSTKLGITTFFAASVTCNKFRGNGLSYWCLPTQSQLTDIYTNLVGKGFLEAYKNDFVWSRACNEQGKPLCIHFTDGKWYFFEDKSIHKGLCSVLAVRRFEFNE